MAEPITDATVAPTDATTNVEISGQPTETTNQETVANDFAAKLAEYEAKIKDFQTISDRLEKEKNEAKAESLKWQASYKGLQKQSTASLQAAAKLEKDLAAAQQTRDELLEVKEILGAMASRVLDESERKEIEFKQRENRIKLAEQAASESVLRVQDQQVTTQATTQYQDLDAQKSEFLHYYFPGEDIDPADPNIDWGEGATSPQEAFRRVNASVLKIKGDKATSKSQDLVSQLQKEAEETLTALKAQQAEFERTKEAEVEKVKVEAAEAARKEHEKKLRDLGIDAGTTPRPDARRKLANRVEEELDETLLFQGEPGSLKRKAGELEYARRLDALKKQIQGQ